MCINFQRGRYAGHTATSLLHKDREHTSVRFNVHPAGTRKNREQSCFRVPGMYYLYSLRHRGADYFTRFSQNRCHAFFFYLPTRRDARVLAAAELRQWELETEQAPSDELRFWKLAAGGGVHAVTVPDALFAGEKMGQHQGEGGGQQQHQPQQRLLALGAKNENAQQQASAQVEGKNSERTENLLVNTSKGNKTKEQKHQREPKLTSPGSGLDDKRKYQNAQETRSGTRGGETASAATAAATADLRVDREVLVAGGSSTALGETETGTPPGVDRFGRKIKVASSDADRHKVKRLDGPPEGTLTPLGWGWGGEFRLGTGRDGFETWPSSLHPHFKVQYAIYETSNSGKV